MSYNGCGGSVTIPDGIIGIADAFYDNDTVESVYLPDSLKFIGQDAFGDCENLKCVVFGNGLEKIEAYAFMYCTALTEIFLPESLITIGNNAFENCVCAEAVHLPSSLVTIGKYAFSSCSSIQCLNLPQSIRKIDAYAFVNCNSLNKIISESTSISFGMRALGYIIGGTGFTINSELTLVGTDNSRLHDYAFDNSINFETMCQEHTSAKTACENSCAGYGYEIEQCTCCGYENIINITAPHSHCFSDWANINNCFERTCSVCGQKEYDNTVSNNCWSYSYTTGLLEIFDEVSATTEFNACKANARYLLYSADSGMDFNTSTNLLFAFLDKNYDTYPEMFEACNNLQSVLISDNKISWMPCSEKFIITGNYEKGYATGFGNSANESDFSYAVTKTNSLNGTGAEFDYKIGRTKIATTTAVIYGDLNSDGISDGTDAVIANAIVAGMLPETDGAFLKALDCDKNGINDEADIQMIFNSGLFIEKISQDA